MIFKGIFILMTVKIMNEITIVITLDLVFNKYNLNIKTNHHKNKVLYKNNHINNPSIKT